MDSCYRQVRTTEEWEKSRRLSEKLHGEEVLSARRPVLELNNSYNLRKTNS
jgi:hypothetical protein